MSELLAAQATQSPFLAGIRRAEAMALAGLSLATVVSFGVTGVPISFALLATAAILLPRTRAVDTASREEQRLKLTRELLSEGKALRTRYRALESEDSTAAERARLEMRFEIVNWVSNTQAQLEKYPEFAGIYEAHYGSDLVQELDGRLHRLAEIARLAQASRRLGLSI